MESGDGMYIYSVNYLLMILLGMLLLNSCKNYRIQRMLFCIIASFQWIVLSGLRHVSVGSDTIQYYEGHFRVNLSKGWGDIFSNLLEWLQGYDVEEPGYFTLQIFFQTFSDNYQVFLIFVACLFTIPLGWWIYKNSADPLISFAVYFGLFSSFFATTGIAQTVATAVVLFGGYEFLRRRKIFPFLLICMLGGLIHKSALFFIVIYFIGIVPISKIYFLCAFSAFGIIMLEKDVVMQVVTRITGYTSFIVSSNTKPYTFTLIYVLVCVVIAWRHEAMLKKSKDVQLWINAVFMGLLLLPTVFINASAMRGVQYFSVFLMLIIPTILETFQFRDKKLAQSIILVLLGIMFFQRTPYYQFFWQ